MTREELMKRLVKIKGRPKPNVGTPKEVHRRDVTSIEAKAEHESGDFDSFFEFEEELAEMESARIQMEKLRKATEPPKEGAVEEPEETLIILEEAVEEAVEEEKLGDESSFLTFEEKNDEEEIKEIIEEVTEEATEETSKPVVSKNKKDKKAAEKQNFKRCLGIKKDGNQCKRQASKDNDYCSAHRKMLNKD